MVLIRRVISSAFFSGTMAHYVQVESTGFPMVFDPGSTEQHDPQQRKMNMSAQTAWTVVCLSVIGLTEDLLCKLLVGIGGKMFSTGSGLEHDDNNC